MQRTISVVPSVADAFATLALKELSQPRTTPFSLFLSGGSTAGQAYARLAERSDDSIDWTTVDVYWGDERCVPLDDPDSNHLLGHQKLLDSVGPTYGDHPMYVAGDPATAAVEYQSRLAEMQSFDLIHLGMGPDGHCASLFPGASTLTVSDPDVLVLPTRDPNANNPHDRITLTFPAIARARLVIFTVSGPSKAEAFGRVVAGDDLPAGRVSAERVIWLVDADAVGSTAVPNRSTPPTPPVR